MAKKQPIQFDHYSQSAPTYTESILWHRVVSVLGSAVILFAGIIWLSVSLFSPTPKENLQTRFDVQSLPATNAIPAQSQQQPEAEQPTQKIKLALAPAQVTATSSAPISDKTAQTEPKATPKVNHSISNAQPEVATPAPKDSSTQFQVAIKILNQDISDAALTQQMQGLEPATVLDNTAELSDEFIKLYFYTDLNGRAGDTLTYTWLRNDKPAAKVRIPVGSDRWRSHASKNINKNMRGDWRVIVTDRKGNTLATSRFKLKPLDNG